MAVIRSEDCGSSLFRLRIRDFMLNKKGIFIDAFGIVSGNFE